MKFLFIIIRDLLSLVTEPAFIAITIVLGLVTIAIIADIIDLLVRSVIIS